jgi:DNA-binding response OmpR family regulator
LTAGAKKRVLAVDDDPAAVTALRQILTQKGYEVVTAHSGEEALPLLADQEFDLAILDVAMPGMSGYDLCRKMRKDARTMHLPVIFLTAKALLGDMAEGKDAGSDLYIIKPVLASKLLSMVGMFLSEDSPLARKRTPPPGS